MNRQVVFLDCETNGVEDQHEAWDVAWWNLTTNVRGQFFAHIPDMSEFLGNAEVKALRMNRFVDRYPLDPAPSEYAMGVGLSAMYAALSAPWVGDEQGPAPVIIGSKPTFDQYYVGKILLRSGFNPRTMWHHHPIDLGAYAAGVLGIEPGSMSVSAESVANLVGVPPGDHSAEGDVTSGGRAYLLLREAARRQYEMPTRSAREWIESNPMRGDVIERELIVASDVAVPRFVTP